MLSNPSWRRIALLGVLTIAAGCNSSLGVPSAVPVRGTVKFKGAPASGIRVTFHPQRGDGQERFLPIGETGADGGFSLSTGEPNNGAPPGEYLVTFMKPELSPTEIVETEIDAFQGKYSDPTTSPFRVTVVRGENVLPPFELD